MESSNGRRQVWVLCAAYFLSYAGVGAIQQYIAPYLHQVTGRPKEECAWVLGAVYLSGILTQFLAVMLTRRIGSRWTVILGLGLCTVFSWVMSATNWIEVLVVATPVWSLGASCLWVAGPAMMLDQAKRGRFGSAIGILYLIVSLGQAIGVVLLGWVALRFGNEALFRVAACISLAANVVSLALPRVKTELSHSSFLEGFYLIRSVPGVVVAALALFSSFGFGVLLGNLSGAVATHTFAGIGLITLGAYLTRPVFNGLAGPLSDRFGRPIVLIGGYIISAAGLLLASMSTHVAVLAAASIALGVQIATSNVALTAFVGDWAPPEKRHVLLGTLFFWKYLGISLAILAGAYLETWLRDYRPTFAIFAGAMVGCALLSLLLPRGPLPEHATVRS